MSTKPLSEVPVPEDPAPSEYVADAPGPEILDRPYPDWNADNSRVVSGPLGPKAKFPGRRFSNWREAEEHLMKGGRLFAFWTLGQRYFARVPKEASKP